MFKDDQTHRSVHLVGACGAGMKALAELLLDREWIVSGSDLLPPSPSMLKLIDRGMIFHRGHAQHHLPERLECLVHSSAVLADNPERREAARRDIPQSTYSQMVGQLMRESTGVCIAGTHGKSTTTAMVASILDRAGRLSGVLVGAELIDKGRNGWSGSGDLFTVESCEFQHSFWDFQPAYAAILSIEPDHFDCYPTMESLKGAFQQFAEQTNPTGFLLINNDCPASREVSANTRSNTRRVTFGVSHAADWIAQGITPTETGTRLNVMQRGKHFCSLELRLNGHHNAANALAATALCAEIGIDPQTICETLKDFRGIRRRMEFVGDYRGRTFVDDYAHHPTAVKATLSALRKSVGNRKILCIFQPHQILRTRSLMDEFAASFDDADKVWIAPVYAARESTTESLSVSRELAERIGRRTYATDNTGIATKRNGSATAFASLDQIVTTLEDASRPGDVVVTMGAGDIDWIYHEFTRRVQ